MRRTAWTLLTIWLLQLLLAGTGWARASAPAAHTDALAHAADPSLVYGVAHSNAHSSAHSDARTGSALRAAHLCHDSVRGSALQPAHGAQQPPSAQTDGQADKPAAHSQHTSPLPASADSHHCCAVGLGLGLAPLLAPLPQGAPHSVALAWLSLSTRPDLRPPI